MNDRVMPLIGRILLCILFLLSGTMKLMGWHLMAGMMASKGFPMASVMLAGAVIVEILGGLCVLFGFKARIAAFIMFLYLIPTTCVFHNFWAMQGAARMENEMNFLKNLAIMGGLLMLSAYGPGRLSIDGKSASSA